MKSFAKVARFRSGELFIAGLLLRLCREYNLIHNSTKVHKPTSLSPTKEDLLNSRLSLVGFSIMSVENTETTEGEVSVETTEVSSEASAPSSPWSADLDFSSLESNEAPVDVAASDEPEPSDPLPSDGEVVDGEGEEEPAKEEVDPEDTIDEAVLEAHDPDKPVPLSRKKKLEAATRIIEPFRDPNTPISDVLEALTNYHPTRAQELMLEVAQSSAKAYPDEWLKAITGLDVTLQDITDWHRGADNPAPTAPSENSNEISTAIAQLTELYGENWRNLAETEIDSLDLPYVKALKAHLDGQEAQSAKEAEYEAKFKEYEEKIASLKPEIDEIKSQKEAEYEAKREELFTSAVNEYRQTIEQTALPKVFKATGLEPSPEDAPEVAAVKELVSSHFKSVNGYVSDFDLFIAEGFSQKEQMSKAMQRVGAHLKEAAKLEAEAYRKPKEKEGLLSQANALKAQAKNEQDALKVWTQKAAKEFLDGSLSPIMKLIEQNADLQRRLSQSGLRAEVVGGSSAPTGNAFINQINKVKEQGGNVWDVDISQNFATR
jgi:hypothetical protein